MILNTLLLTIIVCGVPITLAVGFHAVKKRNIWLGFLTLFLFAAVAITTLVFNNILW